MIRITRSQEGSETVIRVAGHLDCAHLEQLQAECDVAAGRIVIDLSELQGADAEGIRWLCGSAEKGVRVTGTSPYIAYLLERFEDSSGAGRAGNS